MEKKRLERLLEEPEYVVGGRHKKRMFQLEEAVHWVKCYLLGMKSER